jgi:hypothetical protein
VGDYNPHAPVIVGNEWVPLRDPGFKPDNVTEYGTLMHIDNSATAVTGYYYIKENVPNTCNGIVDLVSVYPAGAEADTGPIRQVTIPASSMAFTGAGIAGTIAGLLNPQDDAYVVVTMGDPSTQNIGINFDVASYQGALQGKRILNVELLFQVSGLPENLATSFGGAANNILLQRILGVGGQAIVSSAFVGPLFTTLVTEPQSISLGDVNLFWTPAMSASSGPKAFPWRWEELNQFSITTAPIDRMIAKLSFFNPSGSGDVNIGYAAMRVTYCEERRILYGGDSIHSSSTANNYLPGPRPVQLMTPQFTAPSAIAAGDYTVTVSHRLYGDDSAFAFSRTAPKMYGITEYVPVVEQRGKLIRQSLIPGDTFSVETTDFLPQLTLHTSAGIVTGSHPYGSLVSAPVYGSITAAQLIASSLATGGGVTYPQVRFYARRFGTTTMSLQLSNGTATTSITPTDFDALDEIADGWREVTLRFASAPTSVGLASTWTFSAADEVAGNRWEVLGAGGVSASAPQNIGPATYQAPTGSTQTLTWKSPTITGAAADTTSDVTLMFSQDPPTIIGAEVTQRSLTLTQVDDSCGITNGCVPTAVTYNRISWTAPAITGGFIELQRMDAETDWQTILLTSSVAITGLDDYEARVGEVSSYRVRALNSREFAGNWSATVTGTISSPGVTVGGDGTGVLIFTSNIDPTAALAYTMVWEGQPAEMFVFPEADTQTFQRFYGRDFQVAFRPLERGGEQFDRVMLIQRAAVTRARLANMTSLRDLAWDTLPYVCVRDELGNRWFANVLVPSGTVQNKRRIYLAQIKVTETTDTAVPVGQWP